jgi:probable F420-dependent oxidoreductase
VELALFMNTHGVGGTIDGQWTLQHISVEEMRVLDLARRAETLGFHSLWFSDHVLMVRETVSQHLASDPVTGKRAYPKKPNMLDGAVTMGAVAACTSRIKLASSVLVAPYRHPLSDARQFATVDALSGGRFILGVGAGWMREEFDALGIRYDDRVAMTEECIEIYKRAWRDDVVEFDGEFYRFANVSMDPKPRRVPPIVFGGVSPLAGRITARSCDGFYPTFVDPLATPDRYRDVQDQIRREAQRVGRTEGDIAMLAVVSARIDRADPVSPGMCKGSPARIIDDLGSLANEGFSLAVMHIDCRTGTASEHRDQIEMLADEVLPAARDITAAGEWRRSL